MDRLAEEGVGFDSLITVHSYTSACVTTLLTGLYPIHHGMRALMGSQLHPEAPVLPDLLRQGGYTSYMEATGPLLQFWKGTADAFDVFRYRPQTYHLRSVWCNNFIRKLGGGTYRRPWFIYLHVWDVHPPRRVPLRFYHSRYGHTVYDRSVSAVDEALGRILDALPANTLVLVTADHGEAFVPGRSAWLREGSLYVQFEHLRRRIPELDRLWEQVHAWVRRGKSPNAAIGTAAPSKIQGPKWAQHARCGPYGHGWHIYDSLVRVPLICWWKEGLKPRGTISAQVRQVDIMPTILEAAGCLQALKVPIDGESLWPACHGQALADRPAISEACTTILAVPETLMASLRQPPYKYACRPYAKDRQELLFDLQADPGERQNVIAEQPGVADRMRRQFWALYAPQGVPAEAGFQIAEMTPEEEAKIEAKLRDLGYLA